MKQRSEFSTINVFGIVLKIFYNGTYWSYPRMTPKIPSYRLETFDDSSWLFLYEMICYKRVVLGLLFHFQRLKIKKNMFSMSFQWDGGLYPNGPKWFSLQT